MEATLTILYVNNVLHICISGTCTCMVVLYFYLAVRQYVCDLKTSFWNDFILSLHSGQDPGNVTQRWNLEQEQEPDIDWKDW